MTMQNVSTLKDESRRNYIFFELYQTVVFSSGYLGEERAALESTSSSPENVLRYWSLIKEGWLLPTRYIFLKMYSFI